MDKDSKLIKYGDYITIRGYTTRRKNKQTQNIQGFLSSPSFTQQKVFFQVIPKDLFQQENNTKFDINGDGRQLSTIKNYYRDFVFQIWPKCAFEAHKDYRKLLKQKQQLLDIEKDKKGGLSDKEQEVLNDIKSKLIFMKERTELENTQNSQLLKGFKNNVVTYGSEIQFQHADSKMFLNGKILASEAEKSGYKFELSNNYSGGMIFKILPKFKLRQLGEPIQYIDTLIIMNNKLNCFINFQVDFQTEVDRPIEGQDVQAYMTPGQRFLDTKSQRYDCFLSLFSDIQFKVKKHGSYYNEGEQKIRGGQFIRLRYTELEAFLCADNKYQNGDKEETFLRNYDGEFELENQSISSIWEIECEQFNNRGQYLNSEDENGQTVNFRLRHFQTGKLLCVDDVTLNEHGKKTIFCLGDAEKDEGKYFINFTSTKKGASTYLEIDNCYNIGGGSKQGFIKLMGEVAYELPEKEMVHIPDFFTRISEEEIQVTRYAVEYSTQKISEHAFWVESVQDEEIEDILYIQTAYQILSRLTQIFKKKQKDSLTQDFIFQCQKTLADLIFFVIKMDDKDQSPYEVEGISNESRQQKMRDMRMLELLTDLLYYPFHHQLYDCKDLSTCPSEILKIFQLTYRLIKFSICEYRPNEIYCSQWIELFMNQAMEFDGKYDMFAEPTLTELIDNNKYVLENKINEETINKFVDLLIKQKDVKFLNLLKALINCNGEAVTFNQAEISKLMLQDENARSILINPFRKNSDGYVEIQVDGKYLSLVQLGRELEFDSETKPHYQYFIVLIELLADLCLDRNFTAIDPLREIFSIDLCYDIISDVQYNHDLRTAFTKFTLTCWIDGQRLPKLDFPNYLRIWKDIPQQHTQSILSYDQNQDLSQFSKFKQYIVDYLKRIVKNGYQKVFMDENNKLTEQIITMAKSFIDYGLYSDLQEIQQLIIPLLAFQNGAMDVRDEEEDQEQKKKIKKKTNKMTITRRLSRTFTQGGTEQDIKPQVTTNQTQTSLTRLMIQGNKAQKPQEFEESEEQNILINCRKLASEILETVYVVVMDLKATNYLVNFKNNYSNSNFQAFNIEPSSVLYNKKQNKILMDPSREKLLDDKQNEEDQKITDQPLQWLQDICDEKDLDYQELANADYNSILANLFLYNDKELNKYAFKLLQLNFSKKEELINYLKEIQLFEEAEKIDILNHTKEIKNKLSDIADTAEKWFGKKSEEGESMTKEALEYIDVLFSYIIDDKKGLLKQQMMITSLQGNHELDQDLSQQPEHQGFGSHHNIFAQSQKDCNYISYNVIERSIRPGFQKLMKNLQLYKPLLEILKFDNQMMTKKEEEKDSLLLIRRIYKLLSFFVFNNEDNQSILEDQITLFYKHLEKNRNTMAYMLVQEIYRNNPALHDITKVEEITDILMNNINQMNKNDELKPVHMDALKIFMKDQKHVLKQNQISLIQKIGAQKYTQTLTLVYNNPQQMEDFKLNCDHIAKKIEEGISNPKEDEEIIEMPSFLDYFISQINIMSIASEDKNASAESKCQTFFPLENLATLINSAKNCWPLRKSLIFFFYHVYLETEKQIDEKDTVIEMVQEMKHDLVLIADMYEQLIGLSLTINTFKGRFTFKSMIDEYLYKVIFEGIFLVISKQLLYGKEGRNEFYQDICNAVIKIAESTHIQLFKDYIAQLLYQINQKKSISLSINFEETIKPNIPSHIQSLIEEIESKGFQGGQSKDIDNIIFFSQDNPLSPTLNPSSPSENFAYQIHKVSKCEQFESLIEHDFESMVRVVTSIEKISKTAFSGFQTIKFETVIKKVVVLLDPQEEILSVEQYITGLKILRKIIEMQNLDKQNPAAEWETEDYEEYEKLVVKNQNILVEYGIVDIVCQILAADLDKTIKEEAILLGCALLLGGNRNAQEAFYNYLENDPTNKVMIKLNTMINTSFNLIKKAMDRRNKARFNIEFGKKNDGQNQSQFVRSRQPTMAPQSPTTVQNTNQISQEEQDDGELEEVESLRRVFRFLQLFCEGHYSEMQNFLRVQIINNHATGKSVNFLQNASMKFGTSLRFLNENCTPLASQILDFLTESLQGPCAENQQTLVNSKIVEFVKEFVEMFQKESDYYRRGFITPESIDDVNSLASKSTGLLLSLIEGNVNTDIAEFLNEELDFFFIKKKLSEEYQSFVSNTLKLNPIKQSISVIQEKLYSTVSQFEGNIAEAFNMYLLIVTISDLLQRNHIPDDKNYAFQCLEGQGDNFDLDKIKLESQTVHFFQANTGSIEVYFKENLHRIFFPIQPTCKNLSKVSRTNFMNNVSRASPNDKLGGLINASGPMFTEMLHSSWLKTLKFQFTSKRLSKFSYLSTLQAFLINIVLIFTLIREFDEKDNNTTNLKLNSHFMGTIDSNLIIQGLGGVQLFLSVCMMVFWVFINAPTIKRGQWNEFVEENQPEKSEKLDEEVQDIIHPKYLTTKQIIYLMRTRGPYAPCFTVHGEMDLGCFFGWLYYYEKNFIMVFSNKSVMYMIFYIVCSVIGFFVDPIIYCFHLLDIMNRFPLLKNVILSVTKNFRQLALTFFLGLIIIYIYTVIGYHYLNADWYNGGIVNETGQGENMCTNMWQCFLWATNYGLRNGGGISESLSVMSYSDENKERYYVRFIYDVSFFTLVTVIFLNIIFGIIIDTFGGLRDEKVERDTDMKTKCYICGLERVIFEKNADGFENHIERDHQAWNYLYYLFYLEHKDSTEYNGVESEIVEQIESLDISWFPIMKAISVGNNEEESEKETQEIQDQALEKLTGIKDSLQDVLDTLLNNQNQASTI